MKRGILFALLAAATFGASTPLAKLLVGSVAPVMLAGLLYAGSGLGLLAWHWLRGMRRRAQRDASSRLRRADLAWLAAATLFGGVAGPVLLLAGLAHLAGSTASLLLNFEGVLTSLLAWCVFKENVDRRILLGMLLIVAGGVLLSWDHGGGGSAWGALAVAGACLCWAIDNNLTRKIADSDAVQIACIKGLAAGAVNLAIAFALGMAMPSWPTVGAIGLVGFCGYGLSLVLFVLALRGLGTARTGAYFSAAPFVGALLSLLLLGEAPAAGFWAGGALMAAGILLHLSERHAHTHTHQAQQHNHSHRHDAHHQHVHAFDWDGAEPHTHAHQHTVLTHIHAHFPDTHHRHTH